MNHQDYRYERKFIIDKKFFLLNIESILLESKFSFSKHYSDRMVNSIYFEKQNFNSLLENIDGSNIKKKIRLRWYGDYRYINNPKLEIKKKIGHLNKKKIFHLKDFSTKFTFDQLPNIYRTLKKKFIELNDYSIISSTHYNRKYYISLDKKVRATLDFDIFYKKLKKDFEISNQDFNKVLEIKYNPKLDNYIRENLKNITFRISKNSKYFNSLLK